MKNLFFAVTVATMAISCAKTAVVYEETDEVIGITPVAAGITKGYGAMTPATGYNADEHFAVWAYYDNQAAGAVWSGTSFQTSYIVKGDFGKNGTNWTGATPYYWPKEGSLLFAGMSPYSCTSAAADGNAGATDVSYNPAEAELTITGFIQGTYANTLADSKMVDLMWFDLDSGEQTSSDKNTVTVKFSHALAWLTFKVWGNTAGLYTIKSMQLTNVCQTGDFNSKADPKWSSTAGQAAIELLKETDTSVSVTELQKENAATVADNVLVIPQNAGGNVALTITFTQTGIDADQTVTFNINDVWNASTHYTYVLAFNAEQIELAPTIPDEWTTNPDTEITVQ